MKPETEPKPLLAEVALDVPGRDGYTYSVPGELADLRAGDCVLVPFGARRQRGFVIGVERKEPPEDITLKAVLERRDDVRLPAHLIALIVWGARYYRCSLGEFLSGAVPAPVREGVRMELQRTITRAPDFAGKLSARQRAIVAALPEQPISFAEAQSLAATTPATLRRLADLGAITISEKREIHEIRLAAHKDEDVPLTSEQQQAVDAIHGALSSGKHQTFLLHGVTGSGKTLVYMDVARRVIAAGRKVLLLLPEIALTPQLAGRIRRRFDRVAIWHSGFTDGERAEQWRKVAAGEVDIVLGTRSALFAPLPSIGLIIVDEEHEQSYKQESVPRYHARDLAVVYASQLSVPLILGSATPSLESVLNARQKRYQILRLASRPLGGQLPTPVLIDMRAECKAQHRQAMVCRELIERLQQVRDKKEQAIVLLNRRGWSPVVSCFECGHTLMCKNCDISLTYHRKAERVRCHYCAYQVAMPKNCPACGQATLTTFGLGTEQLATTLSAEVAGLKVLRVDADTVGERQGHARFFQAFADGAADCLVGTQMVAKGLDFPRVTLVGIVGADRGLSVPDFRAAERTYQLIAQVSGRAGRGERPGTVVVQAFDVDAPAIRCALSHQAKTFYDGELRLREDYRYPPYGGLVRILWSGPDQAKVQLIAQEHGQAIAVAAQGLTVLGPNPAGLSFLKGQHRWHALVKAPSRGAAQTFLTRLGMLTGKRGVRVAVDVDPYVTA